jgi:hypothetical protein
MDSQPIRDERILEALEVCRPGGEDLADPALADLADQLGANPELRTLYERLQRVDREVAVAFREVPVPEGLAQRILDRLAAAGNAHEAVVPVEEVALATAPSPAAEVGVRPRRLSRRWLAAAGTLCPAAVLLVAALIYLNLHRAYDAPTVLREASAFFADESPQPGHLLSHVVPPEDYPISRDVRALAGTRWRGITGFLGRSGVAYDLPGPDGISRGATLYVVDRSVDGLKDTVPPLRPQQNTGNCCVGLWRSGGLLYVLVVRGGAGEYRSYLAPLGAVT